MKLILLLHITFGPMLDAAIRIVLSICASEILFRHFDLQYLILCELFAKINTSKHPNQF